MSRREQTMVRIPDHPSHSAVLMDSSSSSRPFFIYPSAQTFSCFVFLDFVSAIQNRGLGCGITQNRMLLITVAVSFLSQLGLVYVPFVQAIF
jgi:Ca2+-transporting ATPase